MCLSHDAKIRSEARTSQPTLNEEPQPPHFESLAARSHRGNPSNDRNLEFDPTALAMRGGPASASDIWRKRRWYAQLRDILPE